MFAALDTRTGEVIGKTVQKHNSEAFVAFLVDVVARQPKGVDGVAEALAITVAAGPVFQPLDAGVDPFGPGVGHPLDHRSEDSFQVLPNHAGHTLTAP